MHLDSLTLLNEQWIVNMMTLMNFIYIQ